MNDIVLLVILALLSLVTSIINAAAGMGGGVLLLAILPNFLPANAILPIHGVVQLSNNFSRFILGLKNALLKPILMFSIGAIIGAAVGYHFLQDFKSSLIPVLTSIFILLILWLPAKFFAKRIPGKYFSLGVFQTAISLYVGATGPMSASVLISEKHQHREVVSTNAGINISINIFKTIVFFALGFAFNKYLLDIIFMCVLSILGSYIGIKIQNRINQNYAQKLLKAIITYLCLMNIYIYFR